MAFLNPILSISILLLATLLILSTFKKQPKTLDFKVSQASFYWNIYSVIFLCIGGFLFYTFPILNDFYGNARSYSAQLNNHVQNFESSSFLSLLQFNLEPGQGRNSVSIVIRWIAYFFGLSIKESFYLLNTSCGVLFLGLILKSIALTIPLLTNRILLSLVFMSSSVFLNFYGHIETYAPVLLLLLCFLYFFRKNARQPKFSNVVFLCLLWLAGLRFHSFFLLLGPALLIGLLHHFFPSFSIKHLHFKNLIRWLILPALIAGTYAYFFVFQDYNDPRALQDFKDIDRLFLPILSPEVPLDKYNLFSFNHILDFLNVIFFWSPALFYLIFVLFKNRQKLNWNAQVLSAYVLSLFLFSCLLFAINPLLSMPMDWDLFVIPVCLVFCIILEGLHELKQVLSGKDQVISLALVLLCIPTFLSTLSQKSNGERILSVGKHVYKSYYEHSSTYILFGLRESGLVETYTKREKKVINDLKPFAVAKADKQYADLLIDQAISQYYLAKNKAEARYFFLESVKYFPLDPQFYNLVDEVNSNFIASETPVSNPHLKESQTYFAKAIAYKENEQVELALESLKIATFFNPRNARNYLERVELFFQLKKYTAAYQEALILAQLDYFEPIKMNRILIHLSLEAEEYNRASMHCRAILEENPEDQFIQEIATRIKNKDRLKTLKFKFKSSL